MAKRNKMHDVIYRLRKRGVNIDTGHRTIYYTCDSEDAMKSRAVIRLCKEWGFARQSQMCDE